MISVQPAILEHDLQSIQRRLDSVRSICDEVHLDIMDGEFVPNTTVNDPNEIAQLNWGKLRVSLHLMIARPELYLRRWAFPEVSSMVVHREAVTNLPDCVNQIRQLQKQVAVALNPSTTSYDIKDYLSLLDFVMIMGVEPGFAAQAFDHDVIDKISYLHDLAPALPIAVDGGVNLKTKPALVRAGATILCANSYLFKTDDLQTAYNLLKQ